MKLKRKKWKKSRESENIGADVIATLPKNADIKKISEEGKSPVYVYYTVPEEDK